MSGQIFWKERALVTLTSAGASIANGSGAAAGTDLDVRASGNASEDFSAIFGLICQWATVTAIAAGTTVAELYLVPKVDGTNLPQIDLTATSSYISPMHYAGTFIAAKVPTANADTIFSSMVVDLAPLLYTAHIINRSGQTIAANWTLKVVSAQAQYT